MAASFPIPYGLRKEELDWWKNVAPKSRSMADKDSAEFYRSRAGAKFIVDDDTVWLHIEAPSRGHAPLYARGAAVRYGSHPGGMALAVASTSVSLAPTTRLLAA
jgi:hypothetical protein